MFVVVLGILAAVSSALGQQAVLTVRDAKLIVEQIPEVQSASTSHKCPVVSFHSQAFYTVELDSYNTCGPPSAAPPRRYTVDKRTGEVKDERGNAIPLAQQGALLRAHLLEKGAAEQLAAGDAACAVRHLHLSSDLSAAGYTITVSAAGKNPNGLYRLLLVATSPSTGFTERIIHIAVDAKNGEARDIDAGEWLDYNGPQLRAALIAKHRPASLTPEAAKQLADLSLASPGGQGLEGCRATRPDPAADSGDAYRFLPTEGCRAGGHPVPLMVNMYTGIVRRVDTNAVMESNALAKLGEKLRQAETQHNMKLIEYAQEQCAK